MKASNRQKKILRFFEIKFSPNISVGAAGWEIGNLMHDKQNGKAWRKYLYLTSDFDSDSDQLKPFEPEDIASVEVPGDWSSSDALASFREEIAEQVMGDGSPFDSPSPPVQFEGKGVSVQILTKLPSSLPSWHATEPAHRISRRLLPRDGAWQPA